jgi:hypothetical protein
MSEGLRSSMMSRLFHPKKTLVLFQQISVSQTRYQSQRTLHCGSLSASKIPALASSQTSWLFCSSDSHVRLVSKAEAALTFRGQQDDSYPIWRIRSRAVHLQKYVFRATSLVPADIQKLPSYSADESKSNPI